jgi:type I restriction enzyme S subunit
MNKEKKLVPELRFPEFKKNEDWETKVLGELVSIKSGTSPSNYNLMGIGKYPFLKVEDLNNSEKYQSQSREYSNDNNNVIPKKSIIFPKRGAAIQLNKVRINIDEVLMDSNLMAITPNEKVLSDFLYYEILKDGLYKIADTSTIPQINNKHIEPYIVIIPKQKEEQQKIASCLSSLDELINAHTEKLDVLKDHKKGLMQNLFPQDCETAPKYRFPEFENDGDWVFEQFDNVYFFLVTNSFSRENLNYKDGTVKNIHYGDIHTKFSTLFDITKETVPYINSNIFIERIRQECYCKEGDLVFADASEDLNDVGKSIEIVNLNDERLLSGLHTLLVRQIESKLITGFGGHLFLSNRIRNQIKKEAQGAKVLGISGPRLSNIIVYYPRNKKEQKKIASCLSALDELISVQAEKIEQLKLHKRGLMQGLFPKIND